MNHYNLHGGFIKCLFIHIIFPLFNLDFFALSYYLYEEKSFSIIDNKLLNYLKEILKINFLLILILKEIILKVYNHK